jgi:hypothetical protein
VSRNAEGSQRGSWRVDLGLVWVSDHRITRSPDLLVSFAFPITSDYPILSTPPGLFSAALKTNHFRQSPLGRRLRAPCVTQAWPLGDPSVTQSQSQRVGRGSQGTPAPTLCRPNLTQGHPRRPKVFGLFCQIPRANYQGALLLQLLLSKTVHYTISRSGADLEVYHLFAYHSRKKWSVVGEFGFPQPQRSFLYSKSFRTCHPGRRARPANGVSRIVPLLRELGGKAGEAQVEVEPSCWRLSAQAKSRV